MTTEAERSYSKHQLPAMKNFYILLIISCFVWTGLEYSLGLVEHRADWFLFGVLMASVCYFLAINGFDQTARVLTATFFTLLVAGLNLSSPEPTDYSISYFALLGGAFLAFSSRTERQWLALFAVAPVCISFVDELRWGLLDFPSLLSTDAGGYRYLGFLVIYALVAAELFYISRIAWRMAQEMNAARARAEEADKAKSRFLTYISHEIRTPLNGIVGLTELLAYAKMEEEEKRMVDSVSESAQAILSLVDEILENSETETGNFSIRNGETNLLNVVERALESVRSIAVSRNVGMSISLGADLPEWIETDAARLRQILLNLLGNAVKFGASDDLSVRGHVNLAVKVTKRNALRFIVTDEGPGIPEDIRERLFEEYARSKEHASSHYSGTGLGLSICQQLVRRMGGTIWVQSEIGKGACFQVELPLKIVKRPKAVRDLGGARFIAYVDKELVAQKLEEYLGQWNANLRVTSDLFEFVDWAKEASDDTGIILSLRHGADHIAARRVLSETNPKLGVLSMTDVHVDRHALFEPGDLGIFRNPILPTQLFQALRNLVRGQDVVDIAPIVAIPKGPSVLVADDDSINREVLVAQLRKLGLSPDCATDGYEALSLWSKKRHEIVFTDCNMPSLSGYALTAAIRQIEDNELIKKTTIWAYTGESGSDLLSKIEEIGMDGILTKPVRMAMLRAKLAPWLDAQ